jgi:hypothetical protein
MISKHSGYLSLWNTNIEKHEEYIYMFRWHVTEKVICLVKYGKRWGHCGTTFAIEDGESASRGVSVVTGCSLSEHWRSVLNLGLLSLVLVTGVLTKHQCKNEYLTVLTSGRLGTPMFRIWVSFPTYLSPLKPTVHQSLYNYSQTLTTILVKSWFCTTFLRRAWNSREATWRWKTRKLVAHAPSLQCQLAVSQSPFSGGGGGHWHSRLFFLRDCRRVELASIIAPSFSLAMWYSDLLVWYLICYFYSSDTDSAIYS